MSFIVDGFDDLSKWAEFVGGTGSVLNKTPDSFQCYLPANGDEAALISSHAFLLPDVQIKADAQARDTRFAIIKDPAVPGTSADNGYRMERDVAYGEVFVWTSGVEFRMPDPVPVDQLAEMRIVYTVDPDTVTWPNGRLTFYYDGAVIFETSPHTRIITPSTPLYVLAIASNTFPTPRTDVTATFQSTGYVPPPPPSYNLTINSNPEGIPFTIKEVGMSYVTPWQGNLEEGTYEIEIPSNVIVGSDTYNFVQWEDGSTNPIRIYNHVGEAILNADYQLQIVTALEVHAFVDSVEVAADGLIVETGYTFQTPITIEVPPGSYTIRLTYLGITKEYTANPAEGETIRVDGQMTPPKPSILSWLTAIPPIVARRTKTAIFVEV